MKDGFISIIIPVYNEEKYLKRCLDSVIKQTYEKLEIVIINDGSIDNTGAICREYALRDRRIKFIEQTNHGVAYAKRRGVELAEGEYIGFVDADDFIEENMYEELLECMEGADMVTSGFFFNGEKKFDLLESGIYNTEASMRYVCENMILFENTKNRGMSTNLCNKLFRANKLKDIVYTTALDVFMGEDAEIVYKYILTCSAINITKICGYHYEYISTSITHSVNEQYIRNVDSLYKSLKREFETSKYREVLLPKLEKWIWNLIQDIPLFLGWKSIEKFKFLNPYMNLLKNKKVILYGAGAVGKDYYRLNEKTRESEIILWVDSNWSFLQENGMNVEPVEAILSKDYDYILVAVKNDVLVREIEKQLIELGVSKEKVLWRMPIEVPD